MFLIDICQEYCFKGVILCFNRQITLTQPGALTISNSQHMLNFNVLLLSVPLSTRHHFWLLIYTGVIRWILSQFKDLDLYNSILARPTLGFLFIIINYLPDLCCCYIRVLLLGTPWVLP